jgi:CubicO group peptidase (beta-lactamase class C family)
MYDTCTTHDVRIRDMLCHRLGLKTFQGDFVNWNSTMSRIDIIHNLRNLKPVYPFRTTWGYCNAGFVTAGQIIENVTGQTFEEFVKATILDPLQMTRSSTSYADIKHDDNAASAYTLVNNAITKIDYDNTDNMTPAASINSSTHDMANWIMMQLNNGNFNGSHVIPQDVLDWTHTSQDVVSDRSSPIFPSRHFINYCLGWEAMDYGGKKVINHDGGVYGFVTNVTIIPEENVGWVILTNTDVNSLYKALQYQFLDAFMNLPYKNYSAILYDQFTRVNKAQQLLVEGWKKTVAKKNPPPIDLK